jgi:hypothetical protein
MTDDLIHNKDTKTDWFYSKATKDTKREEFFTEVNEGNEEDSGLTGAQSGDPSLPFVRIFCLGGLCVLAVN